MNRLFKKNFTNRQIAIASALGALGVVGLFLGKSYFNGAVCNIHKDLTGKVVVITGANTGIGKETAKALASMKATLVLASRDASRTIPVVNELIYETKNKNIEFIQLDLADLSSVKKFAEEYKAKYNKLDILINNAGVMALPERKTTKNGFEMQLGTNHIGHFYLTNLLTDVIKASAPSRIINVSSRAHYRGLINWNDPMYLKGYSPRVVYDQSKLANVIFTKELQRRMDLENADVKVVSLHPGVVRTELGRYILDRTSFKVIMVLLSPLFYYVTKNPQQGAQTSIYCALEDHNKLKGGAYYSDCKEKDLNPLAFEEGIGERLWRLTEAMIAEQP